MSRGLRAGAWAGTEEQDLAICAKLERLLLHNTLVPMRALGNELLL